MKKVMTFLLACCLAVGLCSCDDDDNKKENTTTTVTEQKEELTTKPPVIITPPAPSNETTVKLKDGAKNVLFLGEREESSDAVLNCNYPGSGFEVKIDCDGGTVNVRTETNDPCDFRVYVDGEAWKNAEGSYYYTINGNRNLEIPNVTEGEHTVRVIRVSDKDAGTAKFYNINFEGEQMELTVAEETPFIEFVGDGITLGAGLNAGACDAALSYAYLTANALGYDYAITGANGQGLTTGDSPIASSYGKNGDYTRGADIIVVNVGAEDFAKTGDDAVTAEAFASAYKSFLKDIRTKNGATCKIVCVVTSANAELRTAVESVCTELGGDGAGYYAKLMIASAATAPTAEEHAAYATELTAYINTIKDNEVTLRELIGADSGYGSEIGFGSSEW